MTEGEIDTLAKKLAQRLHPAIEDLESLRLVSEADAAAVLGVSMDFLRDRRREGGELADAVVHFGRTIRYKVAELRKFVNAQNGHE